MQQELNFKISKLAIICRVVLYKVNLTIILMLYFCGNSLYGALSVTAETKLTAGQNELMARQRQLTAKQNQLTATQRANSWQNQTKLTAK